MSIPARPDASARTHANADVDFSAMRNQHETAVCRAVIETAPQFPGLRHRPELLIDVACVALNRLPPRYICNNEDFEFFQRDRERADAELAVSEAVEFAFGFIQARTAMRARG